MLIHEHLSVCFCLSGSCKRWMQGPARVRDVYLSGELEKSGAAHGYGHPSL